MCADIDSPLLFEYWFLLILYSRWFSNSSLLWHRWTVPALIQCRTYLSAIFVLSIITVQALFLSTYVLPAAMIVYRLTNKAKNGPCFHCWARRQQSCSLVFVSELLYDDSVSCLPCYSSLYSLHGKLSWKLPGIFKSRLYRTFQVSLMWRKTLFYWGDCCSVVLVLPFDLCRVTLL